MTQTLRQLLMSAALVTAGLLTTTTHAGPLEDGLLAGASARLDVKGVELALQRGAKPAQKIPHPDAPTVLGTPVHFTLSALIGMNEPAVAQRAERILKILFKAGAKLTGDKDELFAAISGGHDRIVSLLLDQGANPHARIYGYTPAELAIKYNKPKLLPIFYSRGVPKVDDETTAQIQFVHAASLQKLDAMRTAVANGAKIDAPDPSGSVALVQVFSAPLMEPNGYDAVKWLLFEVGADANVTEFSDDKSTALHKVIQRNSYNRNDHFTVAAIAEMLLRKGADVSALDSLGRTPLHYAAQNGNIHAMQVLLRSGAKVMARDALRKTPLDLAKSGEAISLLREAGARE